MTECEYCKRFNDVACFICDNREAHHNPNLCDECQCWDDLTHVLCCKQYEYIHIDTSFFTAALRYVPQILYRRLVHIVGSPRVEPPTFHRLDSLSARSCLVCTVVSGVLSDHIKGLNNVKIATWHPFPLVSKSPRPRNWKDDQEATRTPSHLTERCLLPVCISHVSSSDDTVIEYKAFNIELVLHYESKGYRLNKVTKWDRTFVNTEAIEEWLECCKADHGGRCNGIVGLKALPPGFRLIDTHLWCIVENQKPDRYVALSYVWSEAALPSGETPEISFKLEPSNTHELARPYSLKEKIKELPVIVADAIQLCVDINIRYLWVDRFCIIQSDSGSSQIDQINAMDMIYQKAELTIVALGASGLPGVSTRPRQISPHEVSSVDRDKTTWDIEAGSNNLGINQPQLNAVVDASKWKTRGWTYQELVLSRRHIFFGRKHVYFNCAYGTYHEDEHQIREAKKHFSYGLKFREEREELEFHHYASPLEDYLSRTLGDPKMDILRAFKGVENFLVAKYQTSFLYGLMTHFLYRSLLWCDSGVEGTRDTVEHIPSWSWAASQGSRSHGDWDRNVMEWDPFNYTGEPMMANLVTFYYVDTTMNVTPIKEHWYWFSRTSLSHMTAMERRSAYCDNLQASYLPMNGYPTWDICVHSPWEAEHHAELSQDAIARARNYPCSVVFNTTCASLRLREPSKHRTAAARKNDRYVAFDIINAEGGVVGKTRPMVRTAARRLFPSDTAFRMAVLGATCAVGRTRTVGYHFFVGEPWGLYVMILTNDDVPKRLAIGLVDPIGWTVLQPQWQTIIL
ncbi:heterokaryon incompatibility protein-domain-containing protein, partial [Jackrogersella minutella]